MLFFNFSQNVFLLLDSQIDLLCNSRTGFCYLNKLCWCKGSNKPLTIIPKKGFWAIFFLEYLRGSFPTSHIENCFFLSSRVFLVQSFIFHKIKILTKFTTLWRTKYKSHRVLFLSKSRVKRWLLNDV